MNVLIEYPKLVGFPVTNICNLNCEHCLRRQITLSNPSWNMSIEQAKILSKKFSGKVQTVNCSAGYGEPYLNPYISDILKIFRDSHIETIIYTNGTTPTYDAILNSYTDKLLISVDCYHKKSMKFSNQQEYLLELLSRNSNVAGKIILNCVIDPLTYCEEFVRQIDNICKRFQFIFAEFHWRFVYNYINCKSNEDVFLKYTSLFKSINNPKIILPPLKKSKCNNCSDIFQSLYFDHNGNIRNCCIFYDTILSYNMYNDDLYKIWHSNEMNLYRKEWLQNNGFIKCKNCPIGFGYLW